MREHRLPAAVHWPSRADLAASKPDRLHDASDLPDTHLRRFDNSEMKLIRRRYAELQRSSTPQAASQRQLLTTHGYLFAGIIDHAGTLRTVDAPNGPFVSASALPQAARAIFADLADDNRLVGLDRPAFLTQLAYHYSRLDYLHPFRAGNAITQRLFWSDVALVAGYELDWQHTTHALHQEALHRAAACDYTGLRTLFTKIAFPLKRLEES